MVRTQRQEDGTEGRKLPTLFLKGMQNADRIIHRAIGIHRYRKTVVLETLSYLVGKA